ncbi:putative 6-phosphogluconolactonase [Lachnellula suecica]|uniref:Putative 6-phosphogluconolactonase n=1 Tax=Lachnellula suecica TaxID=602035 RepID=A0A8T9BXR0_9HELO|nr:putative 6-phosphogluconolactonase [Lachnellula suecica]
MHLSKAVFYVSSIAAYVAAEATKAQTAMLYVSSYDGNISTINVAPSQGHLQLNVTSINNGCAPDPSWLLLHKGILFCGDEGFPTPNSSILASFNTTPSGKLQQLSNVTTLNGNVNSAIFGNGTMIALAEYGACVISVIDIQNPSALKVTQSIKFNLTTLGPNRQQSVSRPHQVVFDPTQMFMLSPDLGGDMVRVFHADPTTHHLDEQSPLKVPAGSGPRHAVFYTSKTCGFKRTYLYLVTELSNMLYGYEVMYNGNMTLSFNKVYESGTFGFLPIPNTAFPSEILISPNNQHLLVSSRNDTHFGNSTNPDPKNSTAIVSDSLLTYYIDACTGVLDLIQVYPAGGSYPRSMELNREGNLLAVALQLSSRVVVFKRDCESGIIEEIAGSVAVDGVLTNVVWDEPAMGNSTYDRRGLLA